MKKLLVIGSLFILTNVFSQTKSILKDSISAVKVTCVSYEVTSTEELNNIDWKSIKSLFKDNKEDDAIEMRFSLSLPDAKYKVKSAIKIGGVTKNIDSLIKNAKKGIQSILKIATKYKN